jgi:hypothetical protein
MRAEYLQSVRYKLQKRVRRVRSSGWQQYIISLRQFWTFFASDPALAAIAEELHALYPNASTIFSKIVEGLQGGSFEYSDDEGEWAAVAYMTLRKFAEDGDPRAARKYVPTQSGVTSATFDDYLTAFNAFYLDPFYDYVDERLDDPRFILSQLIRFKHLCEWFWRADLFAKWSENTVTGEDTLTKKLHEFLFTEGIQVYAEPKSASGRADIVGSQAGPEPLVSDSKVFNPDKSKGAGYIAQGFRQVYQYTVDHNESIGYLVIFNTSNKQLQFAVSTAAEPLPRVVVNYKTIFFLVIDIYPHETTASKRPQPEIIEITEAQIVGAATESKTPAPQEVATGPAFPNS